MPTKTYTVFLFSNDPRDTKPLWTKDFRANDADDADERAVKLVSPQLRKFPTAEDWAVYEKGKKRGSKTDPAEELAIRFLLAEDMVEHDGKAKLAAAPKPPHGGQRAEKLVDKTDKHVLWRTGGVQGQMTKMWVITDYTGRYLEVGGRPSGYRKKREAMDAWSEVKAGNFKMTRAAGGFDFGDWDTFDKDPPAATPEDLAVADFERQIHSSSEIMAMERKLMRDAKVVTLVGGMFRYVRPHKGWFIYTGLSDSQAVKLGLRAFRGLVGRRNLPSHFPALHQVPLWVGTSDGKAIKVPSPKGSKTARTNAKVVEVPNTFHAVNLEPPKKVRKQYPFEGYIDFQGIKIDVENVKGGTRSGTGPEGDWSTFMHAHYGEIRGTEGTDGDMLDVYVGDNHDSSIVVVIHQHNPWDGAYDEDKVVIGCESVEEAIGLYKKQYDRPGFFLKDEYTAMPIGAFWRWVNDTRNKGKRVKAASAEGVLDLSTSKTLDYKFIDKAPPGAKVMLAPNRGVSGQDWRYYVYEKQRDGVWNAVLVYVGRPTFGEGAPFIAKPLRPRRTSPKKGTGPGSSQYDSSTWYEDLKYGMVRSYSPGMFKKGLPRTAMWKRGFTEPRPGAVNAAKGQMSTVLALLRALQWNHLASHWQISGDSSYGDHQLFDRIYGATVGEVDDLAEKLVGTFGPSAVDPENQAAAMHKMVTALAAISCPFERGLHGERVFQVVLKDIVAELEGLGQLSLGLDDFLRTLANNHETTLYLLQQRHGGVRVASATASPKQAARRRERAFTARSILLAAGSVQQVPGKPTSKFAPHTVRQNVHGDKKWYPVSGKGVWALEGHPSAGAALEAAKGIREIKSDGKVTKRAGSNMDNRIEKLADQVLLAMDFPTEARSKYLKEREAAAVAWSAKSVAEAGGVAAGAVRAQLPGLDLDDTSAKTWPGYFAYSHTPAPTQTWLRYQLPDQGHYMGIFTSKEIPFQAGWDVPRKQYMATSFMVEQKFRSMAAVLKFMSNKAKVQAFIRKGLKTIDPGEAAFFMGKLTPEAVVNRVLTVTADFEDIDEWHDTSLTITLMLRTAKKVPDKLIEKWLKNNWDQVQAKAPSKTPRPAGAPSRYASWDDDDDYGDDDDDYDDGNTDWMMDYPAEGLGWLVPNKMRWRDVEGVSITQGNRRATVHVHASIRDGDG
jgi:hypothetical protein